MRKIQSEGCQLGRQGSSAFIASSMLARFVFLAVTQHCFLEEDAHMLLYSMLDRRPNSNVMKVWKDHIK